MFQKVLVGGKILSFHKNPLLMSGQKLRAKISKHSSNVKRFWTKYDPLWTCPTRKKKVARTLEKKKTTKRGFEPRSPEDMGLVGPPLNRSGTLSPEK